MRLWILVLLLVGLGVGAAYADTSSTTQTNGQLGLQLSQELYCQMKSAFTSNTGLFAGLCIAVFGLWKLLSGNMSGGLILIVSGALLTALPSLAQSFLNGLGMALSGIATQTSVSPPSSCP